MKKIIYVVFFSFCLFVSSLENTYAYFTKEQSAQRLDDTHILYTVTYDFGSQKSDFLMPILALRSSEYNRELSTLTYEFYNDDEVYREGSATGIVLSKASIKGQNYFIPRGVAKRFVFVSLLTLPNKDTDVSNLRLHVTNLPFEMISTKQSLKGQLNPSELKYYVTPTIDEKTGIKVIAK